MVVMMLLYVHVLVSAEKSAVCVGNIGAGVSFCTGAYPEDLLFCTRLKHLVAIEDWKSQSIQQFCVDGKVKINQKHFKPSQNSKQVKIPVECNLEFELI